MAGIALEYAHREWFVLPLHSYANGCCTCGNAECSSPAKHPRTEHGLRDSSDDPGVIEAWWQKWPNANVGIDCGASKIVVIDDDGGDIAALNLPETFTVRTGRGFQYYFLASANVSIKNSAGKLGKNIDVRGLGGYVVAPPSIHASGARYEIIVMAKPVPLPQHIIDRLNEKPAPPPPLHIVPRSRTGGREEAYGEAALDRACKDIAGASEGERNHTLNACAFSIGHLVGGGVIPEKRAEDRLISTALLAGLTQREVVATVRSGLQAGAKEPQGLPPEFPNGVPAKKAAPPPEPPQFISLSERAALLGGGGSAIATGFPGFDIASRGGWRPGGLVIIGGAPGAGKTTLLAQLALMWAQSGADVGFLAADESANGLLIRMGQSLGFDRDDLEDDRRDGHREAKARLGEQLTAVSSLVLADAEEQEITVESVVAEMGSRATAGRPRILLADSVQTIRVEGSSAAESPRERIDCVMAALKRIARAGVLVVASCELARGAYRSKNAQDQIDDLAAFKESGGIEYGATLAMVLRTSKDSPGNVDVSVAKNRWGRKDPVRLRLDFNRSTFQEVALPPQPPGGSPELNSEAQFDCDLDAARRVLVESNGIYGLDAWAAKLKGMRKERARAAIRTLISMGEVEDRGHKRSSVFFPVSRSELSDSIPF